MKYCVYNGVPARTRPLLDRSDRLPEFKQGLLDAIDGVVEPGEQAVVIGGGQGVSSTWLAQAGADVVAFEAAEEMIEIAHETVDIAGVADRVEHRHRIIGDTIDVYGQELGEPLPPSALDTGDVLLLDCEGAEQSILAGLEDWPRHVIVETHPGQGVPGTVPRSILDEQGYEVNSLEYEPDNDEKEVLVATQKSD